MTTVFTRAIKTINKFTKLVSYNNKLINSLPESIGHLIWPFEWRCSDNMCPLCLKPLNTLELMFNGSNVHLECYYNLEPTQIIKN